MTKLIEKPSIIEAVGTERKLIQEFFGRVNTQDKDVSIARMVSEEGWEEGGQKAQFDEYTVVLKGRLRVETRKETMEVRKDQGFFAQRNEWIRYSTPWEGGAEYIAVCLPAFGHHIVHRDAGDKQI